MFVTKYFKSLPRPITDILSHSKETGAMWNSMTDAEKQPYKQEEIDARAAYEVKREEYWKNIDYKKVNEINRRRRAKGKTSLRRVTSAEDKLPMSSFLR